MVDDRLLLLGLACCVLRSLRVALVLDVVLGRWQGLAGGGLVAWPAS